MINPTSPKSIMKQWIKTADKRKIYSFSVIFEGAKEIIEYEHGKRNNSESSLVRRYFEAISELKSEFEFVPVKKKSAESWFRIIKK
jgi:predicted transcriptional regulator